MAEMFEKCSVFFFLRFITTFTALSVSKSIFAYALMCFEYDSREQIIKYDFSWIYHLGYHQMLEKTRFFNLFYGHCQDNGINLYVSNQSCQSTQPYPNINDKKNADCSTIYLKSFSREVPNRFGTFLIRIMYV